MKKGFYLYTFILATLVLSCRKDHHPFSESPDARLTQMINAYTDTLVNAPYGWRGFIFPSAMSGGVVSFYWKFNDSNRVQMFSDFDSASNVTMMESSYLIKAVQQIDLIFDTYSYVSVLSDPDASVNGGSYGAGLGSDIQFVIDSVTADTIKLHGTQFNTQAYMVKATQQEKGDFYAGNYNNRNIDKWVQYLTYWKRVTVAGNTYEIEVYPTAHRAMISWADENGTGHTQWTAYYYSATGVKFLNPVVNGGQTLGELDNVTWNASSLTSTVSVDGTTCNVLGNTKPLNPDINAFTRWYAYPHATAPDGSHGWTTVNTFHVAGADDAYGMTKAGGYYYTQYIPNYPFTNGSGDLMWDVFVFNNTAEIGMLSDFSTPVNVGDGRARFTAYGPEVYNTDADSVPFVNNLIKFSDASGYYFVQTDSLDYDMVGAKDAQSWINWFYY